MNDAISHLPDDDIVCFIDAYDVLINNSMDTLVNRFKEMQCDVVISAEINCYPSIYKKDYDDIISHKLKKNTHNIYLNSGGYIGYKWAINEILNWKNVDEVTSKTSDQAYFIEFLLQCQLINVINDPSYFSSNLPNLLHIDNMVFSNPQCGIKLKLDHKSIIFQSMCKLPFSQFTIKGGKVVNKGNKNAPCFIHFNGKSHFYHGKSIMPKMVERMYSTKENEQDQELSIT